MTRFRRGVLVILVDLAPWSGLEAAPIEVRFAEGTAHGLILVRSVSGETVGHGDFGGFGWRWSFGSTAGI
jgi:hypothetical protein